MRAIVALFAGAMLLVGVPASARDATSAEVRDLAERARTDPSALSDLRTIDRVDGRRVDIASAIDGTEPGELRPRLATLGGGGTATDVDAGAARRDARSILADERFGEGADVPRPFAGVIDRMADFLDRNLTKPFARAWRWLVDRIPGRETTLWIIVGVLAVATIALVAWRIGRRRRRVPPDDVLTRFGFTRRDDPRDFERRAEEAERRGDHALALRLRFAAGILRLDGTGAIRLTPSLTAGQIRRSLRLAPFDRLSGSFERVTYGGAAATIDDVERTKADWREVLEKVPV
jgi:hypothetical protein